MYNYYNFTFFSLSLSLSSFKVEKKVSCILFWLTINKRDGHNLDRFTLLCAIENIKVRYIIDIKAVYDRGKGSNAFVNPLCSSELIFICSFICLFVCVCLFVCFLFVCSVRASSETQHTGTHTNTNTQIHTYITYKQLKIVEDLIDIFILSAF